MLRKFKSEKEARKWMYEFLKGQECFDNDRFAFIADKIQMAQYEEQQRYGCCGSFDKHIIVGNKKAIIGCNFGH